MKVLKYKIITYLILALFAGFITGACGNCDDGNNFEDQEEIAKSLDSLSVAN